LRKKTKYVRSSIKKLTANNLSTISLSGWNKNSDSFINYKRIILARNHDIFVLKEEVSEDG